MIDHSLLRPGHLVAFQIGEVDGFSAPNADKWGVLKILRHDPDSNAKTISVLDGIADECPTAWSVRFRQVLCERRFKTAPGLDRTLIFQTLFDCKLDLKSARIIGRERVLRPHEKRKLEYERKNGFVGMMAAIHHAALSLDHEDRAKWDADRFWAEIKQSTARREAEWRRQEERQKTRLRGITLDRLLSETQFADWDNRTQIVPPAYTDAVRAQCRALMTDLAALGAKPRRGDARKRLKAFVAWLNSYDAEGYAIETEEREDLMEFLEEICWAIKQKPLLDEIDNWREW